SLTGGGAPSAGRIPVPILHLQFGIQPVADFTPARGEHLREIGGAVDLVGGGPRPSLPGRPPPTPAGAENVRPVSARARHLHRGRASRRRNSQKQSHPTRKSPATVAHAPYSRDALTTAND